MTEVTWKLIDFAWAAVGGLIMIVWNMLDGRIAENKKNLEEKIAASHAVLGKRIDECNDEADTQRSHIAKIFDKLEENNKESQKRHTELLTAIYTGLAGKVDK